MPAAAPQALPFAAVARAAQRLESRREIVGNEPAVEPAATAQAKRLEMSPAAAEHMINGRVLRRAATDARTPVMAEHGIAILLTLFLPALGIFRTVTSSFRLLSGIFDGSLAAADRAGRLPPETAEP